MLHRVRSRMLVVGTVGIAALTGASLAPAVASGAPAPNSGVRYAVSRPLCAAPADPAAMRCLGVERVDVPRGTTGSYAYRTAAATSGGTRVGGTGPRGGYRPSELAAAYGFNPKAKRSNLTVGIVLWHDAPTVLADLNRFDRENGLKKETSRSFRKVNERGRTSPLPRRDRGSASEIALDTQAVRGVCNTCRILLVEADGPYDTDLANAVRTAVRLGADIVTNSYGTPERRFSKKVIGAYRQPGVAVVAATGDAGWFGWDYANSPSGVADGRAFFPASAPTVIAVGGTTLNRDAPNHWTETVWNSNGAHDAEGIKKHAALGASGGGCSRYFAATAWQLRAPGYAAAGCHGKRLATDLAMVADPATGFDIYDGYSSGHWITVGGTSLSAPLAAGMLALAGGPRGSRYPSSAVYGNASARPWTRTDVTTGGNGFCGSDAPQVCSDFVFGATLPTPVRNPNNLGLGLVDCSFPRSGAETVPATPSTECTAAVGYDGPSGVGTPRTPSLFARTDPYLTVRWSGGVRHGRAETFRTKIVTPLRGTAITSLTWSWGDHRRGAVTRTASAQHTYRKAGRYTVTVTSRDSRGQLAVTSRTVTVR